MCCFDKQTIQTGKFLPGWADKTARAFIWMAAAQVVIMLLRG